MRKNFCNRALTAGLLAVAFAGPVAAQAPLGSRAAGMAGAFVAVADDATAIYWNPAGVASGSLVSVVIDFGQGQTPPRMPQTATGQQDTAAIAAISATAVGFAFYRLASHGIGPAEPAVSRSPSREEVRRSVQAVTTSTVGVSLVQSLSEHIVVGVTPKLVRGSALDGPSAGVFDVDAGVMVQANQFRLGLVARNLTTPAFARATAGRPDEGDEIELVREVRAGAAWTSGGTGISRVIVSADADLRSRVTAAGDRRDVAAGVETWWSNQRVGLRGGLRRSTIGEARPAVAAGVSAGLRPGMLLDAHVVRGRAGEGSWSIGARMTY